MITSVSNEKIKAVVKLQKKSAVRRQQAAFVVEGVRMAAELPRERLIQAYASQSFAGEEQNRELCLKLRAEIVADHVMAAMSDTQTPQGILAVVRCQEAQAGQIRRAQDGLILVLEGIRDPGNLGTVLRTAEGAGVTGVLMSRDTVDIYNPKVIRSTMGSIYRVPFAYVADLRAEVRCLREEGVHVCAAHLEGKQNYDEVNYQGPTAFLIGNEAAGLSVELASESSCLVRIPMAGRVESLNAAIASALLMYEAARQRRIKGDIR
ncbi:MAG: RNA methyltransferase [Lachnospiraceae bacterium]|jgi:TrmH family RNA methyltransferase|nr:RNA methyltransferase [Lachnospiraceae bacterium]